MSRFLTSRAFSSMKRRRDSTSSPMRVVKISSQAVMSSSGPGGACVDRGPSLSPELRRGHLAESLVALDLIFLFALLDDVLEDLARGLLLHWLVRDLAASLGGLGLDDGGGTLAAVV